MPLRHWVLAASLCAFLVFLFGLFFGGEARAQSKTDELSGAVGSESSSPSLADTAGGGDTGGGTPSGDLAGSGDTSGGTPSGDLAASGGGGGGQSLEGEAPTVSDGVAPTGDASGSSISPSNDPSGGGNSSPDSYSTPSSGEADLSGVAPADSGLPSAGESEVGADPVLQQAAEPVTTDPADEQALLGGAVEPVAQMSAPVFEPVAETVEPVGSALGPMADATDPVLDPVVEPLTEAVEPVVEPVADTVQPVFGTVEQAVAPVVVAAEPVVEPIGEAVIPVVDGVEPVVEPVVEPLGAVLAPVTDAADPVVDSVVETASPVIAPVIDATEPVVGTVDDAVSPVVDAVDPVLAPVAEAAEPVFSPVTETISPVIDPIVETVSPVIAPVIDAAEPVVGPVVDNISPVADPISAPEVGDTLTPPPAPAASIGELTAPANEATPPVVAEPTTTSGPAFAEPAVAPAFGAAAETEVAPTPAPAPGFGEATAGLVPRDDVRASWSTDAAEGSAIRSTLGVPAANAQTNEPASAGSPGVSSTSTASAGLAPAILDPYLGFGFDHNLLLLLEERPALGSPATPGAPSGMPEPSPFGLPPAGSSLSTSGYAGGLGLAVLALLSVFVLGGKPSWHLREFPRPNPALLLAVERPGETLLTRGAPLFGVPQRLLPLCPESVAGGR